jgi:hypothetical protein
LWDYDNLGPQIWPYNLVLVFSLKLKNFDYIIEGETNRTLIYAVYVKAHKMINTLLALAKKIKEYNKIILTANQAMKNS